MLLGVLFQGPFRKECENPAAVTPLDLLHLGEVVEAHQLFALRDLLLQEVRSLLFGHDDAVVQNTGKRPGHERPPPATFQRGRASSRGAPPVS